jgi:hypothetical protein
MARKSVALSFVAFAAMFCATPAPAQSTVWVIDSAHSTARLFAASSSRKDLINVGVARMSGEMKQDAGAALSAFRFEIYPADQYPRIIPPGGPGAAAQSSLPWWAATLISFQSKSVEPVDEHTVRVRGEMTATYVSRQTIWGGPSFRDYYGPQYGPPNTHTATQEVTMEFRKTGRNDLPVTAEWSGSTTVGNSEFPTLWNAVVATTWPVFQVGGKVVQTTPRTDVHCVMPGTTGNDFSGEVCSGAAMPVFAQPEADSVPGGNRKGVANEVKIKLDVYLVKAS